MKVYMIDNPLWTISQMEQERARIMLKIKSVPHLRGITIEIVNDGLYDSVDTKIELILTADLIIVPTVCEEAITHWIEGRVIDDSKIPYIIEYWLDSILGIPKVSSIIEEILSKDEETIMNNKCTCGKSAHEDGALFCNQCGVKLPVLQFGRAAEGKCYYWINGNGVVTISIECGDNFNDVRYECGNYYLTEESAIQAAKEQKLNALAKQWRAEHDPVELDWSDHEMYKYYMRYNHRTKQLSVDYNSYYQRINEIYFSTKGAAEQFLDEYRELILDVLGVE